MEKMFIYTKMQYREEMWLNARQLYARLNLAGMEQYVLSMKIVAHGFVTVPQGLLEPYAKDRFVQRIHANLVEPVWEAKQVQDFYVYARSEEEALYVKMVGQNKLIVYHSFLLKFLS